MQVRWYCPTKGDPFLSEFTDVFFSGFWCLDGNYSIRVDESFSPVVHPPRKVPVPLREAQDREEESCNRPE